jgi:folate-binding protein YgfZ
VSEAFDAAVPLVPRGAVPREEHRALRAGAVALPRPGLVRFRLTGGGRIACLQGLVTCDVEGAGDGAHLFGALLTPKGMIVAPLWLARVDDAVALELPAEAAEVVRQTFARALPPRLCRAEDVTASTDSLGLYGPQAADVLAAASDSAPPTTPGRAARVTVAGRDVLAARVAARGLDGFDLLANGGGDAVLAALLAHGAAPAGPALLEERRILSGFPRLGAEIDERSIPQEVGFDELGAVSYTKGCYVGQETVARVHFRGHPNRRLVGLALGGAPPPAPPFEIHDGERVLGRLTSAAWSPDAARYVGLAVLRREVQEGATLALPGGSPAAVHLLPWPAP